MNSFPYYYELHAKNYCEFLSKEYYERHRRWLNVSDAYSCTVLTDMEDPRSQVFYNFKLHTKKYCELLSKEYYKLLSKEYYELCGK